MKEKKIPAFPVLLVDDEDSWLHSFSVVLRSAGITNIITINDGRKVLPLIAEQPVWMIILDLTMPHISGQELLAQITEEYPEVPVIVVTGVDDLDTAITCMKGGAFDYFVKTAETERLITGIRRAVELRQLKREHDLLRDRFLEDHLEHPEAFSKIISGSSKMRSVFQYIETIAPSGEPALITGETGVGKELFANAIHALSQCEGEFVAVNAAGLDDHVFSDTLFGHKKGAFTGAESARPGLVEQAQDGTLFLDEVGDLPQASQIKLLRLLQEREYFPLGSDVAKKANTRIVTATNRDLNALTKAGEFRKDLFYRLGTHRVHIPPLRQRKEDLSALLEHFLVESAEALNKKTPTYPKELVTLIATYPYPGNVRELKGMVYEAVTHHKGGVLSMSTFREHIRSFGSIPEDDLQAAMGDGDNVVFSETLPTLKEVNDALIAEALLRAENNQAIAAEMLGISRQALNKRLKQKPNGDT